MTALSFPTIRARPQFEPKIAAQPAAASAKGNPLLPSTPMEKLVPPQIIRMPALDRHLWYFKVAGQLNAKPAEDVRVNLADHTLHFHDLDVGLKKLGMSDVGAFLLSSGVMIDRGLRQMFKGEGNPFAMNIDRAHVEATGHPTVARSEVYDAQGNIDEKKMSDFLDLLDPSGKGRITKAQFEAAGKTLMAQRIPGGLSNSLRRWNAEGTFNRAWGSFMKLAAHEDGSAPPYVTRDDVRWFLDGSFFYRRAAAGTP
jgi:hypothetical protein